MYTLYMICIVLRRLDSASGCGFYFPEPITLIKDDRIGNIIVGDILEISEGDGSGDPLRELYRIQINIIELQYLFRANLKYN